MLATDEQSYNFESMSRIALNARLLIPGKLEGTGRFTHQCYKRLIESRLNDEFLLIFDRQPPAEFDYGSNAKAICLMPPARRPWLFDLWFDYAITRKLKAWKADVFVSTDGYISRRSRVPQLNVIHDINFEHHPEWLPKRYADHFRARFPEYARKADKLCTVSEYSKKDISECYGVDASKITVIPNAPDSLFKPLDDKTLQRDTHAGGKSYIVFVGSLHPRKNIAGIVAAYSEYREKGGEKDLLIVGSNMWRDEEHKSEGVHYAGRLNDEELVNAVAGADAMLYLPFFEGFGVPIVEAMACGVPIVASNVTSIPEVCGDAAYRLVSPDNHNGAAEALLELDKDDDGRENSIKLGLKRAAEFNWDVSAQKLSAAIDELL